MGTGHREVILTGWDGYPGSPSSQVFVPTTVTPLGTPQTRQESGKQLRKSHRPRPVLPHQQPHPKNGALPPCPNEWTVSCLQMVPLAEGSFQFHSSAKALTFFISSPGFRLSACY